MKKSKNKDKFARFEKFLKSKRKNKNKKKNLFDRINDTDFIKEVYSASPEKINRGKKYASFIGKKPKYTREELIAYLKENKIKTAKQLSKVRKDMDPHFKDYVKHFGSWLEARTAAWGIIRKREYTNEEFIKVALEFRINSSQKWIKKRREFPEIIPPHYRILKIWKYWSCFFDTVAEFRDKENIDKYIVLARKLKKIPNFGESEKNDIFLDRVITKYCNNNGYKHVTKRLNKKKLFDDYIFGELLKKEYKEWK